MVSRHRTVLLLGSLFLMAAACRQTAAPTGDLVCREVCATAYGYPASKIWAHRVNDIASGRMAEAKFVGMEVDLVYSECQDQIFVGHDTGDTLKGLTFEVWLDSLHRADKNHYWLDIKNLTCRNASRISSHVRRAASRHDILQRVMVESSNDLALKIVKDSGLYVILWVDNMCWSGATEEEWFEKICRQIDVLHPDALSCDDDMFPRLPDAFPQQHIHIWDTPRDYTDSNVAHSRMVAAHPSVKVVLVDYPEPF